MAKMIEFYIPEKYRQATHEMDSRRSDVGKCWSSVPATKIGIINKFASAWNELKKAPPHGGA